MDPENKVQLFKTSPYFSDLPAELYLRLAAASSARKHTKGSHIFSLGDAADELYVIDTGLVCFQYYTEEGKRLTLGIAQQKMIIGDMELVDPTPRKSNAIALRDTKTLHISKALFLEICREQPILFERLLKIYSRRLQQVAKLMLLKDDMTNLCYVLLSLSKRFGNCNSEIVFIDISQSELASFVGIPRQRLNQMINKLKDDGILEISYGKLGIVNTTSLQLLLST